MISLSIISAENKRKEIEALRIAREMERIAHEALRGQRVEQLVEHLFNMAKCKIENSEFDCCEILITETLLNQWGKPCEDELMDALNITIALLEKAGYCVNPWHGYSASWRTRSGRVGYLYVRW
jgi:hypothetical protein